MRVRTLLFTIAVLFAVLLAAGGLVLTWLPDRGPATPIPAPQAEPSSAVEAAVREFIKVVAGSRAEGIARCTASLQALFAEAEAANGRAMQAHPDQRPPLDGSGTVFFGIQDAWQLEHVEVLGIEGPVARVQVVLALMEDGAQAAETAIVVLRQEGDGWRVDDIQGHAGTLRDTLRDVVAG